tara:strand:- start:580 stop:1245 length:666 start_codon:yes stop_codon:yes gene_type:complete
MININKLEKDIKIKFRDKQLITKALTHKSFNQKDNNEKLEFLGDRVIGLVLSKKLLDIYPSENEGILDKRFATLVNRKTCCDIAWTLNLQNHIIMGNQKSKITKTDEKILSDCCEAIIGAIYIDRGFEIVKNYVLKIWKKYIEKSSVTILDPKTKLQEYSLKKYKKLPFYRLLSSTGPKHNPLYKISVSIIGTKQFVGVGSSKQQAQLDAAAKLLKVRDIK